MLDDNESWKPERPYYMRHYKLVKKTIVECNLLEWGLFLQSRANVVKQEIFRPLLWPFFGRNKCARVSTVFLGLDHRFGGEGPPILFETMIFGGKLDQYQERCCTYAQAIEMHAIACLDLMDAMYGVLPR